MRAAAATLGRLPRAVLVLPRVVILGKHGRRRLLALAVLAIALGAAYLFWFRDSSFVRVEKVTVTGIDAPEAARVRAKLTVAAKHMTTLHLDAGALRRAVADEPVVNSISVQAEFPHGLKILVVENRATALLVSGGRSVAVAPDGTLLEGEKATAGLPEVRVATIPPRGRLPEGPARDRVAVAAAAPARLRARVESISIQHGRGAVAELRDGPVIIFGHAVELRLKWAAAAAVIAERSSAGATYIDVRMHERPVAGGIPPEPDTQTQPDAAATTVPPATPVTPSTAAPTQVPPAPSSSATAATAPAAPVTPATTQAQP